MKSLSELYRIGRGPSSSHTMGPQHAAHIFKERYPAASRFEVTLYGSLAATGKGHMTDVAIMDELKSVAPCHITWNPEVFLSYHPNGMKFEAFALKKSGPAWELCSPVSITSTLRPSVVQRGASGNSLCCQQ